MAAFYSGGARLGYCARAAREILACRAERAVDSIGRAAIRRFADFGGPRFRPESRECLVAWLRRQYGEVPEWLKGTDCKSVGSAYVGSNPTLSTTAGPEAGTSRETHSLFAKRHGKTVRRGCSSMVEQQPSKLNTRVRFPSPAPDFQRQDQGTPKRCAPYVVAGFIGARGTGQGNAVLPLRLWLSGRLL